MEERLRDLQRTLHKLTLLSDYQEQHVSELERRLKAAMERIAELEEREGE